MTGIDGFAALCRTFGMTAEQSDAIWDVVKEFPPPDMPSTAIWNIRETAIRLGYLARSDTPE